MPPRIPLFQCLRTPNAAKPTSSYPRSFTTTSSTQASTKTQRRRHQDPYAIAQAKARKAANISRQEVLAKERASTLGDPVRGVTTDYLRSFDTVQEPDPNPAPILPKSPESGTIDEGTSDAPDISVERDIRIGKYDPEVQKYISPEGKVEHLNYFLDKRELDQGIEYSRWLSTPSAEVEDAPDISEFTDDKTREQRIAERQEGQDTAAEALKRISSLSIGSSKDRLRVNVQRCVNDFGRHNTDNELEPRPQSLYAQNPAPGKPELLQKTPRVGPDTGSSEVQIAILTAKIRTLADFLETRGRMDKSNKRNLRLLVHRRAKLLKYLRRKERGGPRFQNVVNTLGLTDGTWKGEITIMGPLGGHSSVRLAKLQGRNAAA